MTETESKIVQLLKSGNIDLSCQLWVGSHPRTGCLGELACIIIDTGLMNFYEKISNTSVKLNDYTEVKIHVSGPSMKEIRHITVLYKGIIVWSIINNPFENKDVLHAAINVALNYMIYNEFKSSRLDCSFFISSIVIQGLPNQSELFNEPIKT